MLFISLWYILQFLLYTTIRADKRVVSLSLCSNDTVPGGKENSVIIICAVNTFCYIVQTCPFCRLTDDVNVWPLFRYANGDLFTYVLYDNNDLHK